MNPLIQCKRTILPLLIAGVLACFGRLPKAEAVVPAPDGGYAGANTAEGRNALFSLTSGGYNTAVGFLSLSALATGSFNTAIGAGTLLLNTGGGNTAVGAAALLSNTTGVGNTATGLSALGNNMDGIRNTANGVYALNRNTSGGGNTAVGYQALANNTVDGNTAIGNDSLVLNTTGAGNTATGAGALSSNDTGSGNTANGASALVSNSTGNDNTAIGNHALVSNTTSDANTAVGFNALYSNTTQGGNTAVGYDALALTTGANNTAVGKVALGFSTTGSSNIALGDGAGFFVTTANNVICIGHGGANVDNSCFIRNIRGVTTQNADAIPVLIDSTGQLGTANSSRRFKKEIKPMDQASEFIHALKPVTFHYKSDATGTPQFGLIAEEVAEVNPDLVVRDENGEIYTVRYDAVNAMLLNEFLKEHCKVEEQSRKLQEQESTIAQQRKDFERAITELRTRIETVVSDLKVHDSKIQKVTAQIELSKPGGQTALNDP